MVSKCANPQCSSRFHYLHDGKLFQLELDPAWTHPEGSHSAWQRQPAHRVQHFWLCGNCSLTMTLAVEKGKGVVTVPLRAPAPPREIAANAALSS